MGKVTSDKCHKWVFKEPTECEPNMTNYWQSSFDAVCIWSLSHSHLSVWFSFPLNYSSSLPSFNSNKVSIKFSLLYLLCVAIWWLIVSTSSVWCYLLQLPPEWIEQFESGIQVWTEWIYSMLLLLSESFYFFNVLYFQSCHLLLSLCFSLCQTIAVIQAGHGLLQLGSCKIVSKFEYNSFFLFYLDSFLLVII